MVFIVLQEQSGVLAVFASQETARIFAQGRPDTRIECWEVDGDCRQVERAGVFAALPDRFGDLS
jgi:hypothetical protein